MIQKCALIFASFAAMYSCQSGKSELKISVPEKANLPATFRKYQSTVIIKEDNIRMIADRYALPSLLQMDSTILTSVYFPFPGTNGKFSRLDVRKGEQYNITLPGKDRVFANAGTKLLMNFQAGKKNYVLDGKTWFKSEKDSATIITDSFLIKLSPNSKINIDNYASDSDLIISLTEGSATITHKGSPVSLPPKWEIIKKRATGIIKTKMSPVDVTTWTVGGFRHWGQSFSSVVNEIGRIYNKDVYIAKIDGEWHGLNLDYRRNTIEEAVKLYNTTLPEIKMELSGDSLKVFSRPAMKKKNFSS